MRAGFRPASARARLGRLRRRLSEVVHPPQPLARITNANGADESSLDRYALLVYIPRAFLVDAGSPAFRRHQNLTKCRRMAAVLGELGYVVDVVSRKDRAFRPARPYDLVVGENFDWRARRFPSHATHVFLATSMSHATHNRNLQRRHERLVERRGRDVRGRRVYTEELPALVDARALVGFGNDFTVGTWEEAFAGPRYPLDNLWLRSVVPSGRDWERARRSFLFFASGSQLQKGLDLLLELFPRHPSLHLYVCSRFEAEPDFCECYRTELFETPNVHPVGWVDIAGPEFARLVRECAFVIAPTCSEGQSGSVVQCMAAGLVPLVTREAGIDVGGAGVGFANDTLEEIERVVCEVSEQAPGWHREQSARSLELAGERHSEEAFDARWREILTEIVAP